MQRKSKILFFALFFLFSLRGMADDITELDPATQDKFREVAGMLRCPTCTGLSVLGSDAPFSVQIKAMVKEQVVAGKSKDDILAFFTTRYGPWILREPPKTGINLVAWFFPVALLCLGPLLIWFFVWRHRKVVSTFGVRSSADVLVEFEDNLAALRKDRA
jgi:cytochrome c-type biogenesis protein CcmH